MVALRGLGTRAGPANIWAGPGAVKHAEALFTERDGVNNIAPDVRVVSCQISGPNARQQRGR